MANAKISECGNYRYWLTRESELEHPGRGTALFIMLNPSTADASEDDPTIRRCRGFAKSWECAGLTVANLYALRSTNPKTAMGCKRPCWPDETIIILKVYCLNMVTLFVPGAQMQNRNEWPNLLS